MTNYPGKELELFDKANFWRTYLYFFINKFIGTKVLEVGAGIGSFSKIYFKRNKEIVLSEIDEFNFTTIKRKFEKHNNILSINKLTKDIKGSFDTIMYLSVLEHIDDDKKEIKEAINKLEDSGHLIICVPAHNYMYSNFDREIGHHRRYEIDFFKNLKLTDAKIKKIYFIDSCGYFLYFFNKLIFKKEVYPTKLKIFVWDKIFIPISLILDFFLFYKIGKNIICIIKKKKS